MEWYIHLDKNNPQQLVMFFLGRCKRVLLGILYLDSCTQLRH